MSEDFGKSRVLAKSQLSACCKMGERMKTLPVCKLWTSPEKQAFSLMLLVLRGFHRKSILFQLKSLLIDRQRKDREIDEESTSGWVLGCGAWDGNMKQLLIINWECGWSLDFGKWLKKDYWKFSQIFFWMHIFVEQQQLHCKKYEQKTQFSSLSRLNFQFKILNCSHCFKMLFLKHVATFSLFSDSDPLFSFFFFFFSSISITRQIINATPSRP